MVGAFLTHYRITAKLGEGGMGEVYRALDTKLGREVAIKVLPGRISRHPPSLGRFEREARALAALNHPYIAGIYGLDTDQGTHFLVLELVEGETLAERLHRGRLPMEEALVVARQIAEAIQEAHDKGIIHRDLKPGNVKITPNGRVKVLDFGLAKMEENLRTEAAALVSPPVDPDTPTVEADRTAPGAILGTPAYMSPEQARGQDVDKRTDIWAFGCCLYECLSGQKPFRGQTATDLIAEVLKSDPDWSQLPSETPPPVVMLLRRCLEKETSRRLSTMGDIAILLDESARGLAASSFHPSSIPSPAPAGTTKRHSVAVLPFVNMSADQENEYFSDGITEDLITALSQVDGLRVPARTSSFVFKDQRNDIRRIGRELRVEMVLEGSVRRAGDRLRITAQLINVADGFHRWSERYDRQLKDVFEIQDEIVDRVVGALTLQLGLAERKMAKRPTSNLEAYDVYLLGRHLWAKRQAQDLPKVFELFQQALEKDPAYALAYCGMADYYLYQAYFFGNLPFTEAMTQAKDYALKAVRLDADLGEAHVSLGLVKLWLDWDFAGAAAEFQRSLELNPAYPTGYHFRAMQLWGMGGRLEDALDMLSRGLEIDPLSVPIRNMRAMILSQAGQHDQVIIETKRILELDPHHVWEYLGRAYENTGRPNEAIHWYLRWLEEDGVEPDAVAELQRVAEAEGLSGFHHRNAQLLIERAELLPLARHWQQAYRIQAYARLGRTDEAFRALEHALDLKWPILVWLKVDLRFELLRGDPRFNALLKKIGLPP